MRRIGYPRPRCKEDCGKPILGPTEMFIWGLMNRYYPLLIISNGMGGWSINLEGIDMVCRNFQIEDQMEFIELLIDVMSTIRKLHDKEDEQEQGE
jgi:hypothetical protein